MFFEVERINCDDLYDKLRAGDIEARNKVIESYIPLGMHLVKRIMHPNRKETIAEMTYWLTDTVQRICNGTIDRHKNMDAYIYKMLWGRLVRFARREYRKRHITAPDWRPPAVKYHNELEYQEVLNQFEGREREILDMRLTGMKDEEIGSKLGLTKQRVYQIRNVLREKLERIYDR